MKKEAIQSITGVALTAASRVVEAVSAIVNTKVIPDFLLKSTAVSITASAKAVFTMLRSRKDEKLIKSRQLFPMLQVWLLR